MVSINSEVQVEQRETTGLRLSVNMEKLERAYAEREVRNIRSISKEIVANGDPPSLMLWGDE